MSVRASSKRPGIGNEELVPSSESVSAPSDGRDNPASTLAFTGKPSESRMERIARRAHEIYEARGGQHGKAMEDWLQAEREIDIEMEAPGSAEP
jgi:hypothetical protein